MVGDAIDNALMESVIGLYKTGCIRTTVFHPGPYRTVTDVEDDLRPGSTGTTQRRLHGSPGMLSPIDYETTHHATPNPEPQPT